MIEVFFNITGYYIMGEGVEEIKLYSPALSNDGKEIFPPLQAMYKILWDALTELTRKNISSDVTVYNSSRIMDDLTGNAKPIDDVCEQYWQGIRRHAMPNINGIVFYFKRSDSYIEHIMSKGEEILMAKKPKQPISLPKTEYVERNNNVLRKFKERTENEQSSIHDRDS